MTGPDCAAACNLMNAHTNTHKHTQTETPCFISSAAGGQLYNADINMLKPLDYFGVFCRLLVLMLALVGRVEPNPRRKSHRGVRG